MKKIISSIFVIVLAAIIVFSLTDDAFLSSGSNSDDSKSLSVNNSTKKESNQTADIINTKKLTSKFKKVDLFTFNKYPKDKNFTVDSWLNLKNTILQIPVLDGYNFKEKLFDNWDFSTDLFIDLKLTADKLISKYDELLVEIKNVIKQVKKENYKNYFENAYNKDAYKDYVKKDSTLKKKPKNYKD